MSAIDWTGIASSCGPLLGSLRRGVLKISELGFFLIFVPDDERYRVEQELAAAFIPVHGTALHTSEEAELIFVAVVKWESVDKLRAITYGLGKRSNGTRFKES